MDPILITVIIFILLFILFGSGQPVFAALATASIVGILLLQGPRGLGAVSGVLYDRLNSFTLVAVPLFILMGEAVFVTGIGSELYTAANSWLNKVRGGMAMASVLASAVFGALCGVSIAGAAAIGSFAIPEMRKRGYHKSLAVGPVTAAGALSLLIPPSIAFIVYGEVADESVGKLFLGGVVPGLVLTLLMILYIFIVCLLKPHYAPMPTEVISWKARFKSLEKIWPALTLIALVLGTIYFGICTPTESAAVGCVGSFLIILMRGKMGWKVLRHILQRTMLTTGMILIIFSAAMLFGYLLTRLQAPQLIISLVQEAQLPPWAVMSLAMAILIILGMFMDIVSVILIATPLLSPMIIELGHSVLWFGIIVGITCEMAVITPPIGLNLFVIKGVAPDDISLQDITKAALPFVFVEIIALIIFIVFPGLCLWLPNRMG
jgi:tripartite ATP-independent transporter DctM subunit